MAQGTISVRLDAETSSGLAAYQKKYGMTQSQAIRMLLALSLKTDQEQGDRVFDRRAFKEGLIAGQKKIREKLQGVIKAALSEFDDQ